MCGIAGLYLKAPELEPSLGELFAPMLSALGERGPDSAGLALYTKEAPEDALKITCQGVENWQQVSNSLAERFGAKVDLRTTGQFAVLTATIPAEDELRRALAEDFPDLAITSIGRKIEILKEVGSVDRVLEQFNLPSRSGTHAVGHTRMATESAVSTDGSHPFSTGMDLCLVHNGSLSNYNQLRRQLIREGVMFRTENDSEVAAGFLTWRLARGDSIEEALQAALASLDGFYTFAIGTADGFAVLRDPIACKPAVMAETDQFAAMASEYRALAELPNIENARIWEPEPGEIYSWSRTAA